MDHDGRRDTLWFSWDQGEGRFGIATASGSASHQFGGAAPVLPRALAVNADERGPTEILVVQRGVYLYAFVDCRIKTVTGPDGKRLDFNLGFGDTETGVGCVDADADGRRDLVRLKDLGAYTGGPVNGVVKWERTIVSLDGTHASLGATDSGEYHLPDDEAAASLLTQVTCGGQENWLSPA